MSRKRPCQSGCPHASMLPCEGDVDNDSVCPLCKVHCSYQGEDLVLRQGEVTEDSLALAHAGWCGPRRDKLPASVMRRVQAFLQARSAVLHLDDIINKKDPQQVNYLLQRLLQHQSPVQVAFLQGAIPLQNPTVFPRLLEFLQQCPVWSVNLGELRFSEEQCAR